MHLVYPPPPPPPKKISSSGWTSIYLEKWDLVRFGWRNKPSKQSLREGRWRKCELQNSHWPGTLTSSNDTKGDLTICLNQHQTGGSLLKRITMVCAWRNVKSLAFILTIYLPRLLQDILFLRSSIAKKSWSRWMTKQFLGESAICLTGLKKSDQLSNKV